ncbi:MAG: hypothetical protein NT069_09930, partial [Planctomycetota bacterium]|nr:hypothetical protein [Planctomycetota bacterium]
MVSDVDRAGVDTPCLERIALEMQQQAGVGVTFSKTVPATEAGVLKVLVEFGEEDTGRSAVDGAKRVIQAAIHDTPCDVAGIVRQLRSHDQHIRLGPSTGSIVRAAQRRGIPYRRL